VKVALRDDDTCFFTSPETLQRVYHDVWDRLPVCLATVPFAIGYERQGIPEAHWHSGESFPLEQNAELVAFLRDQLARKRVTIALHGYTHEDYPDGYEFQAAPDPERRVAHGLAYLQERLSAPITVFVPPHNALSKRGMAAVSGAGLNLLGSFLSFRPSMRTRCRTGGACAPTAPRPNVPSTIASFIRTCCATRVTPSLAATA
jgi:hypothetical protein